MFKLFPHERGRRELHRVFLAHDDFCGGGRSQQIQNDDGKMSPMYVTMLEDEENAED